MFPEQRYGRRLHALIASFLGIGYPRAPGQAGKSIVEHAVAVEVDFLSVAGLDEAELAGRIKPDDRSNRRAFQRSQRVDCGFRDSIQPTFDLDRAGPSHNVPKPVREDRVRQNCGGASGIDLT
jgi:hypothetical protein